jgi:uncharacterized 2Fe-2S/4Fe-4S cluster protein (DUF4445 family)
MATAGVKRWVVDAELERPSLSNNTADADRLVQALRPRLGNDRVAIDLDLLKILPRQLRQAGYKVRCVVFRDRGGWVLAGLRSAAETAQPIGAAVDLGTSRVVVRLVGLLTGENLGESAFDNPQNTVGPDVLTRVHHAQTEAGLTQLTRLMSDGLNREISLLCHAIGATAADVHLVALAGNTVMTHLLMGLPPRWIVREPYIPVVNRPNLIAPAALGLDIHAGGRIFVFPNIGSYFGGDLIAGILSAGLHRSQQTAMLVDVGTNAEVVLGNNAWMIGCAGAAGPALESGVTRMGTIAAPGVIDRVRIDPHTRRFELHTIDDLPPKGICGSGVIDLAAGLFKAGMLDIRGKLRAEACGDRLREKDGMAHLVLVPSEDAVTGQALTVSQADFDSLLRSKAAMYTILETVTASVGMTPEQLSRFYVAGTFGAFIDPEAAISIGMLPDLPRDHYQVLGNSCLEGASLVLQSPRYLDEIEDIRQRITYLELNVNQEFMNRFSAAKFLPHTDRERFPSVTGGHLG